MRLAAVLPALSLSPISVAAQTPTAGVTGVVRDSVSESLAEVDIEATNLVTGFSYRATSSSSGRYWLRGLPPGSYDITARRIGLRSVTVRQVELAVGRTVGLDFMLDAAPVETEPLTVRVGSPLIETTQSEISYVLDQEEIERLPEESRQFIELAKLVPGATTGTEDAGGPPPFGTNGASVGALNRQSLGVLVDGGDFTEGLFGDLAGSVPLLALQEFEVVQSQYSAEFGRAASGIVSAVTRRGGNELAVEALGLYRHHTLNARGPFEAEKPEFNRLHWGIAVGGPIVPRRTLFFAAFERRAQSDFATVNTGGAFPSFEGTFETPYTDNLVLVRFDQRLGEQHELTLRYAGEVGEQLIGVGGERALERGRNSTLDMHSGLLAHRWTPGGTWLNEARLHLIRTQRSLLRNAPPGPSLVYPSLRAGAHPEEVRLLGSRRVEFRDDLSWIAAGSTGTHDLKVGAHVSWLSTAAENSAFENGRFIFRDDTDRLPAFGQVAFSDIQFEADNTQLAFYAQDDWIPVPGLALNLGLRYEIETNGSNQGFVSPFAGELPFVRTSPRPVDKNNLSPRIGIAWDPAGDGRTVVRGGFGIFYDALVAGPLVALERSFTGTRVAALLDPGTTNVDSLTVDPDTLPPAVWAHGDIETPMTRQYSLGIEQSLPGAVVVRVDGVFVQGRNLLVQRELNPVGADGVRRFPEFASISRIVSQGRADARMLLVWVRRAFPGGWFNLGYTLADRRNTNDNGGRPLVPQTGLEELDLDEEWGPAAWDERHRVTATGGVTFPFGLGLVAKIVYASARPFTAITGSDDNGDFDSSNDRPPGEERNARRGPDFFQTDLGITWTPAVWGSARLGLVVNIYNLFNTTNGVPSSVENNLRSPLFGRPLEAFAGRQLEVGAQLSWR